MEWSFAASKVVEMDQIFETSRFQDLASSEIFRNADFES